MNYTTGRECSGTINEYSRTGRWGNIVTETVAELVYFVDEPRDPFNEGQPVSFDLLAERTHNDYLAAENVEPVRIV